MTAKQQKHFFIELWPATCAAMGWPAGDREFRLATLSDWLGRPISSVKDADHLKDFDGIKARCLAASQPTNLQAQLRQADMPRRRLIHRIHDLAHPAYLATILRDKFTWPKWLRENYPAFFPLTLVSAPGDLIAEFRAAAPPPPALEDLTEEQLIQLRNTLCARRAWRRKHRLNMNLWQPVNATPKKYKCQSKGSKTSSASICC